MPRKQPNALPPVKYNFKYDLHGNAHQIVLHIDAEIIAEAHKFNVNLANLEQELRVMIDGVFYRLVARSLWDRAHR